MVKKPEAGHHLKNESAASSSPRRCAAGRRAGSWQGLRVSGPVKLSFPGDIQGDMPEAGFHSGQTITSQGARLKAAAP